MSKPWVATIAMLVVAGCNPSAPSSQPGVAAAAKADADASLDNMAEQLDDSMITADKYAQLENGMSYADVVKILGSAGEEVSSSDLGGMSTRMYSWKNPGGSNMNAMFQNDSLVMKAQSGLP